MNIVRRFDTEQKLALNWRTKVDNPDKANIFEFAKSLAEHTHGTQSRVSAHRATVTFTYDCIQPNYDVLFVCNLDSRTREFSTTATLIKNGVPVRISCHAVAILIARHFNRLNTDVKYFMLRVNPTTRQLSIKQATLFTKRQFEDIVGKAATGVQYIITELNSAVEFIRFNLYIILVQAGLLHRSFLKILEDNKLQFREFSDSPQVIDKQFSQLNHINLVSNVPFEFMYLDSLKRFSRSTPEQIKEIEERSKEQLKAISDSFNRSNPGVIVKYLRLTNNENQIRSQELRGHNPQRIGFFNSVLAMRQPKSSVENIYQFQKVELSCQTVATPLSSTDEACTDETITAGRKLKSSVKVAYRAVDISDIETMGVPNAQAIMRRFQTRINENRIFEQIDKVLCWRQSSEPADPLEIHQKQLLSNIMYYSSHYIGRYYFSAQSQHKQKLFVDYYPTGSLSSYKQRNSLCFSLLSKLYLISQVCNGLRFLHDNKIYHLGVRLCNVMMSKGFFTRIIGFEQGYHPNISILPFRILEPPYSAPELYRDDPQISEKADVYSFGVAMCQLIFNCHPHEISDKAKAAAAYAQSSYYSLFEVVPDRTSYHGPPQYMNTLLNLILRCVHPDPKKRPFLEWIVIFLKESITYIDLLY